MSDERISAEGLRYMTGEALWGMTDWREERDHLCGVDALDDDAEVGDDVAMGDNDDIEAEARALVEKRAREREVEKRAEQIAWDEKVRAKNAALDAKRAARPRWLQLAIKIGGPILAVAVAGVFALGFYLNEKEKKACKEIGDELGYAASDLERNTCMCTTVACASKALSEYQEKEAALQSRKETECKRGLTDEQMTPVKEHISAAAECAGRTR